MNTAKAILTFTSIIGFALSWLSVGTIIRKRLLGDDGEDLDTADRLMICCGPLLILIIITFKLCEPVLAYVDSKVAGFWDRRRIRQEAKAAREISEAEPAFDPANYKAEQWKDQTWREELKRQRSTISSSAIKSGLRIRRYGRRKKINGQQ